MKMVIQGCGIVTFGAGGLYLAVYILLLAGVLKETKAFKVLVGILITLTGLGITLANVLSGYPFGGHSQLNRFVAVLFLGLVISGVWIIFSALSKTKEGVE